MKKLYTLGIALSMVAFGTQSMAQVEVQSIEGSSTTHNVKAQRVESPLVTRAVEIEPSAKKTTPTPKDNETVYFSEDFSNGLAGQGTNGAWTTSEVQGQLWFQTFPVGEVGGYSNSEAVLNGTNPLYGTNLPLVFSDDADVVNSPTRDNGVMMVDADRWNSHSTVENPLEFPEGGFSSMDEQLLFIDTTAIRAALVSPPINLVGVESALITFYHSGRLNSDQPVIFIEISVDGQETWTKYNVTHPEGGAGFDTQRSVNISSALQEDGADLENVYVRFHWNKAIYYYWTIDDFAIVALPDDDLIAGKTFLNNWASILPPTIINESGDEVWTGASLVAMSWADYISGFAYENQPEYYVHPFNFGMIVTNNGGSTQTDVILEVKGTAPSGAEKIWTSEPIEIESAVVDTLWINDALLTDFPSGVEVGNYSFSFKVIQAEEDILPNDNIGASHTTRVSNDIGNDGRAIMQNGKGMEYVYYDSESNQNGRDMINATCYAFPELATGFEPKFITHVEVVFLETVTLSVGTFHTIPGEEVFFNVRKNHPYNEVEDDESTWSLPIFGTGEDTQYEGDDIVYTIQAQDLSVWGGTNYKWIPFELPTPVAIEPGVVYMAELRIPDASGPIVWVPASDDETFSGWAYLNTDGEGTIGAPTFALRFRTSSEPDGIEKITFDSGLTLIQNYPNPFTDMTKIQYMVDKSSKVNFEVRDLTGKLVYTRDLGNVPANAPQTIELQRGNLAAGMYTYTIATSEFQVSRKLTVQ